MRTAAQELAALIDSAGQEVVSITAMIRCGKKGDVFRRHDEVERYVVKETKKGYRVDAVFIDGEVLLLSKGDTYDVALVKAGLSPSGGLRRWVEGMEEWSVEGHDIINNLQWQLQYVIDNLVPADKLDEDGIFTFPDGTMWGRTGSDVPDEIREDAERALASDAAEASGTGEATAFPPDDRGSDRLVKPKGKARLRTEEKVH